jgi:hypothetical protein
VHQQTAGYWLGRRAIKVPTAMPQENPNANMAILTGEEIPPQIDTEVPAARARNSSAVATRAFLDFILLASSCFKEPDNQGFRRLPARSGTGTHWK